MIIVCQCGNRITAEVPSEVTCKCGTRHEAFDPRHAGAIPLAEKLGDFTERQLKSIGITPERYAAAKEMFGLAPGCNCESRKQWLNSVSDWWRGHAFANDTQTHPPTSSTQPDSTDESHDDRND